MSGSRRSPYLNWRAVSDTYAAAALESLLTPERMSRRWSGLSAAARELHHGILSTFFEGGVPPDPNGIANTHALAELRERDLIFFVGDRMGAYPFAPMDRGHRVSTDTSSFWAVCAIDAFGIASMLGGLVRIETQCGGCDQRIVFDVDGGMATHSEPLDARIWASVQDTKGCAATSQCRTMRAYCSEDHLTSWAGGEDSFLLSARQATQIGAAIFGLGSAFGKVLADL